MERRIERTVLQTEDEGARGQHPFPSNACNSSRKRRRLTSSRCPFLNRTSPEPPVPPATAVAVTSVNGSIAVSDVQGAIQFNAVNGSVSLARVGGKVQGRGTNGSIFIGVGGDHWTGKTLDVKTVNGAIEIDVPADCAAHVTASTVLGVINTNFPVQIPAGWGWFGGSLSFDVGSGSASGSAIRAATTLGSIQLRRED